jgi:RNA polymerase sigma-70 factor (ECF subfamily)
MSDEIVDANVIAEVQNGNKQAFDALVLKYQYKVFRIISRYISDPSEILDITQETFIKVYKSIAHFRGDSSFYTWLYRIAVNTAKNQIISQERKLPDLSYEISDIERYASRHNIKEYTTPEKVLMCDEMEHLLYSVIDDLTHDLRTTIMLREIEGLTYDEIAMIMGCPVGTVRSRIFRAREAIEKKMQPFLQK